MSFILYAGLLVAGVFGLRSLSKRRSAARALNAVGKNVALVTPRTQPDGSVELQFIIGEFQMNDACFHLRLPSDEAFVVPNPLLAKLRGNPAPELFDGAAFLLRLSDLEAQQLVLLNEGTRDSSENPELHQ